MAIEKEMFAIYAEVNNQAIFIYGYSKVRFGISLPLKSGSQAKAHFLFEDVSDCLNSNPIKFRNGTRSFTLEIQLLSAYIEVRDLSTNL